MSTVAPAVFASPSEHISDVLWGRLIGRVVTDAPKQLGVTVDLAQADEIMRETALVYLPLVAEQPGLSPSPLVDLGWHTFLLYSYGYERFCLAAFGRKIHHEPFDDPTNPRESKGAAGRTVAFMQAHDIEFNAAMWVGVAECRDPGPTADCLAAPPVAAGCGDNCSGNCQSVPA